jgi:hypothetical protein
MWLDDAPTYVGPLSSRTHGSDFSIFMGIGVAAAVYWVLARRSVPAEEGIMSAPAPAAAHPQAVSLADTDG